VIGLDENCLVFHYADRVKASMIETLMLLDFYLGLEKSEDLDELMMQILNTCKKEVNLAESICSKIDWARPHLQEASLKIEDGIGFFRVENHQSLKEQFTAALNKITTCAGEALNRMEANPGNRSQ
jgi:hypothetical protein